MKKSVIILVLLVIIVLGLIVIFKYISIDRNIDNIENTKYDKENYDENERDEDKMKIKIEVNGKELIASLVDNSSTKELVSKLEEGSITIDMRDYNNMEKVGELPFALPRNDEHINTKAGDIILYQDSSFVIYYDKNSWSLTRLGFIENISKDELKEILGEGNITITISL